MRCGFSVRKGKKKLIFLVETHGLVGRVHLISLGFLEGKIIFKKNGAPLSG